MNNHENIHDNIIASTCYIYILYQPIERVGILGIKQTKLHIILFSHTYCLCCTFRIFTNCNYFVSMYVYSHYIDSLSYILNKYALNVLAMIS